MRADCSAVRLRSFWNCASRHQGNPNDCARPEPPNASDKTTASHPARQVELIRKPLKSRLLERLRRATQGRLGVDNLLLGDGLGPKAYGLGREGALRVRSFLLSAYAPYGPTGPTRPAEARSSAPRRMELNSNL